MAKQAWRSLSSRFCENMRFPDRGDSTLDGSARVVANFPAVRALAQFPATFLGGCDSQNTALRMPTDHFLLQFGCFGTLTSPVYLN